MARYIVGDIHGSYDKLMRALELCKFSDSDTLYCTGDIGDRGTQVKECIDFLMSLSSRFKSVIGNHDIWAYQYLSSFLDRYTYDTWVDNGGRNTISAFKSMNNLDDVLKWYASFRYMIEEDTFRVVHTLTTDSCLNKNVIPLKDINLSNIFESEILDTTTPYDDALFSRRPLMCLNCFGDSDYDYLKENCTILVDKKLTVIGHTPSTKGVLYDSYMNVCDIDTCGFATYSKYRYEGIITILNPDTKELWDSNGKISNLNGEIYP